MIAWLRKYWCWLSHCYHPTHIMDLQGQHLCLRQSRQRDRWECCRCGKIKWEDSRYWQ